MGLKESQRKYIEKNREKVREIHNNYYRKNKKRINSQMAILRYNKKIEKGEELTDKQKILFDMHKKILKKIKEEN